MNSSLEHGVDEHTALLDPDPSASKPINDGSMISMEDDSGSGARRPNGNNLGLLNGVVVPWFVLPRAIMQRTALTRASQ